VKVTLFWKKSLCDETWIHHYISELKRASVERRRSGEGAPVKAKIRLQGKSGHGILGL